MCFDLAFFENLLIWLVVITAIVLLLKLLVSAISSQFGWAANTVLEAFKIIMWAIIFIAVIVIIFDLIGCLLGVSGLHFPPLHR